MPTHTLKTVTGLQRPGADGYARVQPPTDRPLTLMAGDRLWVQAFAPDSHWVYGVAASGQERFWSLFVSEPGSQVAAGERFPLPQGQDIDAAGAGMDTLYVLSAPEPIAWLQGFESQDCEGLSGQPKPENPTTLCEQLHALIWQAPARIRGQARQTPAELIRKRGVVTVFGSVAEHSGEGVVVVQTPFLQP